MSLTAREVEGASLDLSGDLCVSDGITDTEVASVGNIYAKFINNSTASAFGDIVIQKEIIDSRLLLSGTCQNPSGTIMGSKIAARNGVESGRIGTRPQKYPRSAQALRIISATGRKTGFRSQHLHGTDAGCQR